MKLGHLIMIAIVVAPLVIYAACVAHAEKHSDPDDQIWGH